jgi:hypothetical protein
MPWDTVTVVQYSFRTVRWNVASNSLSLSPGNSMNTIVQGRDGILVASWAKLQMSHSMDGRISSVTVCRQYSMAGPYGPHSAVQAVPTEIRQAGYRAALRLTSETPLHALFDRVTRKSFKNRFTTHYQYHGTGCGFRLCYGHVLRSDELLRTEGTGHQVNKWCAGMAKLIYGAVHQLVALRSQGGWVGTQSFTCLNVEVPSDGGAGTH